MADKKKFVCDFFEKLKAFNDRLSLDVSVFPDPIQSVLTSFNAETDGVIDGFEKMFDGERFVCKDKRFSEKERDVISGYVNSLGRYDAAGESERLSYFKEKLMRFADESREKERRFSSLAVKLSFSFGLTVLILLI